MVDTAYSWMTTTPTMRFSTRSASEAALGLELNLRHLSDVAAQSALQDEVEGATRDPRLVATQRSYQKALSTGSM